ncbi:MAG TPA: sigma-70 family RNA polymerase sigma factor [Deltaproteobacteria bacterium]|jgi:RNA polymerase sigma-70 factor (ECF subfamily)|nr:sigma-70 family RNA polymerase sigma factor [Deltaproteobacteria bacterium]HOI07458.1 sigma-70 family RNA polymerase sigma factor [Deltaproteobacteria bacterium]
MSKKRETQSDAFLVRDIKKGDARSMEEIVKRYSSKVYNLAYHLTRDSAAAEEIMQDVFLTVVAKIGTLTNEEYFSTWLYRVTTNAAYGFLRKEKKFSEQTPVEDIDQEVHRDIDWSDLPDDVLLSEESRGVLRRSIDALPEAMRTVVIMKDIEGLKNEEIAEALGLSVPAVKSRLHRGRLMLRDQLSEYFSKYTAPSGEDE